MKGLVLLYREGNDVTVREYPKVVENNNYYILEEDSWGKKGIMKKYVGEVCKITFDGATCNGKYIAKYPIDIPYMHGLWSKGYFIFVNKVKYDANPLLYHDMIKNYRED